jgi:superfamily II DNA or RNA helicase
MRILAIYLLVADEVHRYGALKFARGLALRSNSPGLTATPERTDDGVSQVCAYFGKVVS